MTATAARRSSLAKIRERPAPVSVEDAAARAISRSTTPELIKLGEFPADADGEPPTPADRSFPARAA